MPLNRGRAAWLLLLDVFLPFLLLRTFLLLRRQRRSRKPFSRVYEREPPTGERRSTNGQTRSGSMPGSNTQTRSGETSRRAGGRRRRRLRQSTSRLPTRSNNSGENREGDMQDERTMSSGSKLSPMSLRSCAKLKLRQKDARIGGRSDVLSPPSATALPDSTTTLQDDDDVQITVDTAMDSFPDLFPSVPVGDGEEDILNDVINCMNAEEEEEGGGKESSVPNKPVEETSDILLKAISSAQVDAVSLEEAEGSAPPKSKQSAPPSGSNLVSSTIHGFPEVAEEREVGGGNAGETGLSATLDGIQLTGTKGEPAATSPPSLPSQPEVFTLTLTDGSVIQLKVQPPPPPQTDQSIKSTPQPTVMLQPTQPALPQLCFPPTTPTDTWQLQPPQLLPPLSEIVAPAILPPAAERASSLSPPSVAEEVVLPYSNPAAPTSPSSSSLSVLSSSPEDVVAAMSTSTSSSPLNFSEDFTPGLALPRAAITCRSYSLSSSSSSADCEGDGGSCSASDHSDEALLSMFTASSIDNVTIETLKAQLTCLPEGQSADLGALLTAAKIDLTVDDIVIPPLTQVKRIMEAKGLSDWQVQLCIKIRRRKKNTAAVRSSRRKRSQYVVGLRDEVSRLKRRRKESQEENALLRQLHSLWARLVAEVEVEIQDGVKRQLGSASADTATEEEEEDGDKEETVGHIPSLEEKDDLSLTADPSASEASAATTGSKEIKTSS